MLWSVVDYGHMCRDVDLVTSSPGAPASVVSEPRETVSLSEMYPWSETLLSTNTDLYALGGDEGLGFDTTNLYSPGTAYLLDLASGGG